jgi:glycosyltransferase involved in cell wall biosynthesis
MRITFLLPSDSLTGGTRVVAVYARKLADQGHDVRVVTCAPDRLDLFEWSKALLKRDRNKLRKYGRPEPGHIAMSGVAHKVLEKPRAIEARDVPDADFIVATWWETALWMHAMPSSKGRKVHLIQGYEVWPNPDLADEVHHTLKLPNLKIAISSDLKRTIESQLGELGISIVPNAVDLKQFDAPERGRQRVPTVGFVYARAAFKGADICIRACELARREIPDLKVVAFGADLPSADLALPAGADYFHRPPQREIGTIYSRCDAWLFGSRHDSFGLPILEAMACRTPVIAVPVGAATELLGDGTGTLVAMESPEEMAEAIIATCRLSENEWRKRSDRAYSRAHGYSWDDATERLLRLLES